jgi:hypothetical protein
MSTPLRRARDHARCLPIVGASSRGGPRYSLGLLDTWNRAANPNVARQIQGSEHRSVPHAPRPSCPERQYLSPASPAPRLAP